MHDNKHLPQIYRPYWLNTTIEDAHKMNLDQWNPTEFTDIELLGIRQAMYLGHLDALC